jgi:hypothetical protein
MKHFEKFFFFLESCCFESFQIVIERVSEVQIVKLKSLRKFLVDIGKLSAKHTLSFDENFDEESRLLTKSF